MPTITANMSLQIPIVGESTYPTSDSNSFTLIDAHDHSSGKGKQIVTGGITDLAVTSAKLASDAVTTAKIADSNVTTAKILDANVTTAKIADLAVTAAKHAALGQQISTLDCGTFQTQSLTPVDVTNLTVTITTLGRPVLISLTGGSIGGSRASGTTSVFSYFTIVRDATTVATFPFIKTELTSGAAIYQMPSSVISYVDAVSAGTYTYKLQAYSDDGITFADIRTAKLIAYEIS